MEGVSCFGLVGWMGRWIGYWSFWWIGKGDGLEDWYDAEGDKTFRRDITGHYISFPPGKARQSKTESMPLN
jgi:hypothetical protein